MNTDTMIELGTEQYSRYLKEAAQERTNGQGVTSRPSFTIAVRNRVGAACIELGKRLQDTTPSQPSPMPAGQSGR